jgi:hypothetical protein
LVGHDGFTLGFSGDAAEPLFLLTLPRWTE